MPTRRWKQPEIYRTRSLGAQELRTALSPAEALEEVRRALCTSELLAQDEQALPSAYRPLTAAEVERLERHGCRSEDWNCVAVADGFDADRVQNCRFVGHVRLGVFCGTAEIGHGVTIPTGVYDSMLANCEVSDDALILRVGLLAGYRVGRGAVVRECTTVLAGPTATFGNGVEIAVGVETGGREVRSYAELSIPVAECIAKRRDDKGLLADYDALVDDYVSRVRREHGYIGPGAIVAATTLVENAYVGRGAVIQNAQSVVNSTILSASDEPTRVTDGVILKDSIVQWGCEVASMSIVDSSILTEHSHVERHGKVTHSIIGPNSVVAEGEVTACLVGPFVSFHHQALLIASLWPEGKGNVAYGANVGSNHTSRAPDQELWPGEGVFFGLGCDIKFPANYTEAPYTVIASGVTTLPQRVAMPFSLINPPAISVEAISPSFNEIMPGWMLYGNQYALWRNQYKYRKRNNARRSVFELEIFRPETVDAMCAARRELLAAEGRQIYTAKHVPGIGKNYMTEQSRVAGIEAYSAFARYYALLALKARVAELLRGGTAVPRAIAEVLAIPGGSSSWQHACSLLADEPPALTVADALRDLVEAEERIATGVLESREKDTTRGILTIPGYEDAHPDARDDPVVQQALEQARALREEVSRLIEAAGWR